MSKKLVISLVVMGMALSACTSSRALNSGLNPSAQPTPLPAAPSGQVEITDLAPPPGSEATFENQVADATATTAPTAPATTTNTQIASLETPKPVATPITKNGMAGVWSVPTDNSGCRVMMAFTKWAGGYRAATKSCSSSEITSISAWDVKGQQVVLVDSSGNTVARLYSSGGNRYDGTTSGGKPTSFRR